MALGQSCSYRLPRTWHDAVHMAVDTGSDSILAEQVREEAAPAIAAKWWVMQADDNLLLRCALLLRVLE